jgi:polyisoprenoid-binding protein YceI
LRIADRKRAGIATLSTTPWLRRLSQPRPWPLLLIFALVIATPLFHRGSFAAEYDPDKSAPLVLTVDPAHSTLHWTLDTTLHLVHGTFAVKRGELIVDPVSGKTSGEIVADATTGKTDNDSRDKKMHQEILETPRFPDIVFRVTQIDGLTTPLGKSQIKLHGTFLIHGSQHDMTIPADAEFAAGHFSGSAKFVVPYIEWGIKNPSNFLLKASPTVDVSLDLSGSLR